MKRALAILILILLFAGPAFAQDIEVAAFAGYATPAGLLHDSRTVEDLKFKGALAWGASVTTFFSPYLGLEAFWSHQSTGVELSTDVASQEIFDASIGHLQASLVYQFGKEDARFRPYLAGGAGVALFTATDIESDTRLAFNLGAGLKWLPSKRFGAALQARYLPVFLNDAGADFCDPFGFCQNLLNQFEVTGRLIVRF